MNQIVIKVISYKSINLNINQLKTVIFNQLNYSIKLWLAIMPKKIDLVSPLSDLPENELPSVIEILAYNKSLENLNKSNDIGKYFIHMSKLR